MVNLNFNGQSFINLIIIKQKGWIMFEVAVNENL